MKISLIITIMEYLDYKYNLKLSNTEFIIE